MNLAFWLFDVLRQKKELFWTFVMDVSGLFYSERIEEIEI